MQNWIKGNYAGTQVVMATRVSLHRNRIETDLLTYLNPEQAGEIRQLLWQEIGECPLLDTFKIIDLPLVSKEGRDAYMHYGYVDADQEIFGDQVILLLSSDAKQAIVLGEKDHYTFRSLSEGPSVRTNIQKVFELSESLPVDYAFHEKFGFLTVDPLLAGFGLEIECLLHLAGMEAADEISVRMAIAEEHGFKMLPVLADDQVVKDVYILTSELQMGLSEDELLHRLIYILDTIESRELELRESLKEDSGQVISKRFSQAWDDIQHLDSISYHQALGMVLNLKLKSDTGHAFFPERLIPLYFDLANSALGLKAFSQEDIAEDPDMQRAYLLRSRLRR